MENFKTAKTFLLIIIGSHFYFIGKRKMFLNIKTENIRDLK